MHGQSSRAQIPCANRAAMDRDRARGDCQAETVTPYRTVTRRVYTVERLENELQILLRNPGSVVSNDYFNALWVRVPRINTNLRAGWRITYGVANHILQSAAQQLRIAVDIERAIRLQSNTAAVRIGLNSNVGDDVGEQLGDLHPRPLDSLHGAFETRKLEGPGYELLEAVRLATDTCQMALDSRVLLPPRERECQLQPCQWRTQLMRDVPQQLLLQLEQVANAFRHRVEIRGKEAQLIVPAFQFR